MLLENSTRLEILGKNNSSGLAEVGGLIHLSNEVYYIHVVLIYTYEHW